MDFANNSINGIPLWNFLSQIFIKSDICENFKFPNIFFHFLIKYCDLFSPPPKFVDRSLSRVAYIPFTRMPMTYDRKVKAYSRMARDVSSRCWHKWYFFFLTSANSLRRSNALRARQIRKILVWYTQMHKNSL